MQTDASEAGHVLVVDDHDMGREILGDLLLAEGYRVSFASNGFEALELATALNPDVILLDVMMPGMNGYETCRRLKQKATTASIPVLMISALTDRKQRLAGIETGATDYLTKPIDGNEVRLRVRNAVQLKQLFNRVGDDLERLTQLESLRDNLIHMIVHDMRSPLTNILVGLDLLQQDIDVHLPQPSTILPVVLCATKEVLTMCESLLDVSRLESNALPINKTYCDLSLLMRQAVEAWGPHCLIRQIVIEFNCPPVYLYADHDLVYRILVNLLGNAIKHSGKGGSVHLSHQQGDDGIRVEVRDFGPGIAPQYHQIIFEKFGQLSMRHLDNKIYSTGLGLTFCKLAVEAHGGEIGVISDEGQGSVFWFTLPMEAENGMLLPQPSLVDRPLVRPS